MPERHAAQPVLLILNQMAGPITWELAEDLAAQLGPVALLTGHPDTLAKGSRAAVQLWAAAPYQRGSFARRALSWLRYLLQALLWLRRWPASTPLLLFSNPPMLVWLGWLLRVVRGQRYAVMVHDIYPDVLVRLAGFAETHPLVRAWRWLNRRAYQRAELVMTLSEGMAATLARQFDPSKTAAGRLAIAYPWADAGRIRPQAKADNPFAQAHGQVDKLTVMYAGNMGLAHDIETMLAAAERVQDLANVHFMFIGAGPKWQLVQATMQQRGLGNVTLLPWQPEDGLPQQLATAEIGLVALEQEAQGLAVPSKALYYLAAGAALLGLSAPGSDLDTIVARDRCGLVVAPGDVDGLERALRGLASDPDRLAEMRSRARQAALARYDRRAVTAQINALLATHLVATGVDDAAAATLDDAHAH